MALCTIRELRDDRFRSRITVSTTTAAACRRGCARTRKRQQVMQELMGDSDLLLKDRLEVRHLMTHNPVTSSRRRPIEEMTNLMNDLRLHHLLVCNRAGDLVGVVSDRDLRPTHGATAQQVMSYPPMTCTLRHARHRGHHLPEKREHFLPAGGRPRPALRHLDDATICVDAAMHAPIVDADGRKCCNTI